LSNLNKSNKNKTLISQQKSDSKDSNDHIQSDMIDNNDNPKIKGLSFTNQLEQRSSNNQYQSSISPMNVNREVNINEL